LRKSEDFKGALRAGEFADLAVLSDDYFSVPSEEIKAITSVLTMVGGRIVHGSGEFGKLAPALPPPSPDWSPVRTYGGYSRTTSEGAGKENVNRKLAMSCGCAKACNIHGHAHASARSSSLPVEDLRSFWGALGCACWAV
jgi:hypothetical protein